ncbi:hypothetical protein ACLKA6_011343 [Drosophila palustris]
MVGDINRFRWAFGASVVSVSSASLIGRFLAISSGKSGASLVMGRLKIPEAVFTSTTRTFTELFQLILSPLFSSFNSSAFLTFNRFTTPLLLHIPLYLLRLFIVVWGSFIHLELSLDVQVRCLD